MKKRKLDDVPGSAAKKTAAADPRFQMDADFLDSDDDLRRGSDAAGPGPGSAGRKVMAGSETRAKPAAKAASRIQGDSSAGVTRHAPAVDGSGDGRAAEAQAGNDSDGDGRHADASADGDEDYANGGSSDGDGGADDAAMGEQEGQPARRRKKVLSKEKLERIKEASDRRGIVYISRIPPHMKPHKLRQLLEPFGELGRVYCAPEDPALRRMRKQKGGNSGKNFTEGWVEFEDKRRAKRAALALNGQPMGGSKRSAYHYDLWTLKYLPKFKWDTLTEEINYQRAVREQRLVAEISAAKRERDFYLSRVDKAKAIDAIKERRAKKQQAEAGGDGAAVAGAAPSGASGGSGQGGQADAGAGSGAGPGAGSRPPRFERHFGQRRAKADPVLDDSAPVLANDVLGLFGRKRQ
ncbi:hypothetical protein GPECTOR_10g889 [Gonium pectorale]|uniref:RRM domain-containing protein n=1 Tax=Gonium pectorale TaxID=33097 RepID=A0A150GR92_GONPE|nr:hypothetical protein GPECTOR_10g889 [Gonium pectorale]|eukprot:KXZ52258.1 hypothetical protein GPECTOR_10g889 [Gonium pectorale]